MLPVDHILAAGEVPAANKLSEDLITLWRNCRQKLLKVQQQDKARADKARRESGISVGSLVLLSTRSLNLKRVAGKLKPRFVGPFKVCKLVGENAAELQLPEAMKVHPVFNVELLKLYTGDLV